MYPLKITGIFKSTNDNRLDGFTISGTKFLVTYLSRPVEGLKK